VAMQAMQRQSGEERKRPWYRFSLRALLVAFTVVAVLLGAVGFKLHRIRHRRDLVASIERDGGWVRYRHHFDEYGNDRQVPYSRTESGEIVFHYPPPGPSFLRRALGEDAFFVLTQAAIKGVSADQLRALSAYSSLEVLSCEDTRFSDEDAIAFLPRFPRLRVLMLNGTDVTDRAMGAIGRIETLTDLHLERTDITDHGVFKLGRPTEFEFISLADTEITDASVPVIARMKCLKRLNLGGTRITDDSIPELAGLPLVGWLDLNDTRISDTGVAQLTGLKNLVSLDLSGTRVTDAGILQFAPARRLYYLDLRRTGVSDEAIRQLEQRMPDLTVISDDD